MLKKFPLMLVALSAFAAAQSNHYLILGKTTGNASFANRVAANGGTVTSRMDAIGVVTADSSNPDFKANMAKEAGVQAVALDMEMNWLTGHESYVSADSANIQPGADSLNAEPFTAYQWNMRQIHADQSAALGYMGHGARVAILDAGAWYIQPDIAPNMNVGLAKSFVPGEGVLPTHLGAFNHGTHVSGIVAAAINNFGVQGVAPQAELVPVKVLAESGTGSFSWFIQGVDYASGPDVHADIINASLGATFDGGHRGIGQDDYNTLMTALDRVIDIAEKRGTLVVMSAGNDFAYLNGNIITIPGQSGNGKALMVSATGPVALQNFERKASYSNWGADVDVAAPGGDDTLYPNPNFVLDMVLSPGACNNASCTSSGYYFADGTSMAAPAVAGVAALIVGKYGHMSPNELARRVKAATVQTLSPQESGAGRIDALKAVQ